MFKKLKTAFFQFSKQAGNEKKVTSENKRGALGLLIKIKLSEEKFNKLFDNLEEELIQANVAYEIVELIRKDLHSALVGKIFNRGKLLETIKETLQNLIKNILIESKTIDFDFTTKPQVIMFVGVNGVGKTTSLAKVAKWLQNNKKSCVFAAADTFRAASLEQLQEHADNLKIKTVKHAYGADPAAVAYDAIEHAKARSLDIVLIDTAGRQHANQDLMNELSKIKRIAKPTKIILVIDSLTGNDAIVQAKKYNEAIGIDAVILTKSDADDKGGTILSVAHIIKKPIMFIGTGQTYEDLEKFNAENIMKKFFEEK